MEFVLSSCENVELEHETATVNPMAITMTNDCLNFDEFMMENWQTEASPASTNLGDYNNVVYTPTYSYNGDFNEMPTSNGSTYQSMVNSPQSTTGLTSANAPSVPGSNIIAQGDNDSDSGIYSSSSSNSPKHNYAFENFEGSNNVYPVASTHNFNVASGNSYVNIDMNQNNSNSALGLLSDHSSVTSPCTVQSSRISCDESNEPAVGFKVQKALPANDHPTSNDLNEMLNHVFIENNRLSFQNDDYSLPNLEQANADPDEQETERLLDNIEQMLKSMQDNNNLTDPNVPCTHVHNFTPQVAKKPITTLNRVNTINESIKLEPVESIAKPQQSQTSSSFKKISPKVSCEANQTTPANKLVSATPATTILATSSLPNTIILQNVDTKISQTKGAKMPLMSRNDKKQQPQSQPQQQIIVTPAQHKLQPQLTVLTAIPAVACQAPALPLIIATTNTQPIDATGINMQNLIPNTIILDGGVNAVKDSPKAKRLKQDKNDVIIIEKTNSPPNNHSATNLSPTAKPTFVNSNQNTSHIDPTLLKKQSRMIKNRESACLSRKRKKEYVQSLEDSLKEVTDMNDQLKMENQQLKEKIEKLESENKLLKEQQMRPKIPSTVIGNGKITTLTTLKTTPLNINLNTIANKANNFSTNNTTSLKRPFIMLAVFFVFGLNIMHFVNLNLSPNTGNEIGQVRRYGLLKSSAGDGPVYAEKEDAQLAALALAQARDGALVDGALLKNQKMSLNSRHLLSDYDYQEEESTSGDKQQKPDKKNLTSASNSNKTNDKVELIMINGSWHLIDLNICHQMLLNNNQTDSSRFSNVSHFNKINNELNGWYSRYLSRNQFNLNANNKQAQDSQYRYEKYSAELLKDLNSAGSNAAADSKFEAIKDFKTGNPKARVIQEMRSKSANRRNQMNSNNNNNNQNKVYPVSLYDTQSIKLENFINTIRQRNDTFYYVSFRRDHVMFPPSIQNKSQRPRMSLLMPALLTTNLSDSTRNDTNKTDQQGQQQTFAFMQIDCEVVDTRLIYFKLDELPTNYMKIINQDYTMNDDSSRQDSSFFNYYSNTGL